MFLPNRPLIAGLALLLGSDALQAASFDCSMAKLPAERLICNVPVLSTLDKQLSERYRAHLAELSEPAANRLRSGQREWLAYWPRYCANDAGKLHAESAETRRCAEQEYRARLETLDTQKRIRPDLVAYPVSHYRVMKSEAGLDFVKRAHHTESVLTLDIDAAPAEQRALAQALNEWLNPARATPGGGTTEDGEETLSDTESQVRLADSAASTVLSAVLSFYMFGHGAAHPVSTTGQLHFHLPSRRPLQASDVFLGDSWQVGLTRQVEQALKKALTDNYSVDQFKLLQEMTTQTEYWRFEKAGLTIQFNPYDVAPYSAGAPSITIPWSSLQEWLNPTFSASLPK